MEQVQMNMQNDSSLVTVVFIAAELDILRLLNVSGATHGVSEVLGPSKHLPAYKFRPGYNNVLVPDPGAIAAALTAPAGFTLLFVYRQHRKTLGEGRIKHVKVCP
jgi:hypothetical protein